MDDADDIYAPSQALVYNVQQEIYGQIKRFPHTVIQI